MEDLHKLKMMYFQKALDLFRKDLNFFDELFESKKCELLKFKEFKYNKKVKILSSCGCNSCEELNGKVYTIDEALKLMPIPNPGCSHKTNASGKGWCRCCYVSGDDPIEQAKQMNKEFHKDLAQIILKH